MDHRSILKDSLDEILLHVSRSVRWDSDHVVTLNDDIREEEVLVDLKASRFPEEKDKRPSMETLLHGLLPSPFVVHTHPALINGITCSKNASELVSTLFGDKALRVSITNPGYVLTRVVRDKLDKYIKSDKDFPLMIFLQIHGVFVAGNSMEEIDSIYDDMFEEIHNRIIRYPDTVRLSSPPWTN